MKSLNWWKSCKNSPENSGQCDSVRQTQTAIKKKKKNLVCSMYNIKIGKKFCSENKKTAIIIQGVHISPQVNNHLSLGINSRVRRKRTLLATFFCIDFHTPASSQELSVSTVCLFSLPDTLLCLFSRSFS